MTWFLTTWTRFPSCPEEPSKEGISPTLRRTPHQYHKDVSKKPLLIIHVGPPKTGTTSLQSALWKYRPFLEQDNYLFLGKSEDYVYDPILDAFASKVCYQQVKRRGDTPLSEIPCWSRMMDALDVHNKRGINLILSDEILSRYHMIPFSGHQPFRLKWNVMKGTFAEWDVRIVFGYRRYYEWILSVKNQIDKYTPRHKSLLKWEQDGGKRMQPIHEHLHEMMAQVCPFPSSAQTYKGYSPHYPVLWYNMHSTDIVTQFLCDIVPNATAACTERRQHSNKILNNPSQPILQYDLLAHEAHDLGLFNSSLPRQWVANETRYFHEYDLGRKPLNLTCPSQSQLEPLLERTIQEERQIFSQEEGQASETEEQVRSSFWTFAAENRFCTVNAKETLKDPEWIRFYQGLEKRYTPETNEDEEEEDVE